MRKYTNRIMAVKSGSTSGLSMAYSPERFISELREIGIIFDNDDEEIAKLISDPEKSKIILRRALINYRTNYAEEYLASIESPWVIGELNSGLKIWCNLIDNVSKSVLKGNYSPIITQLIRKYYRSGTTFCDIGANIGWFTLVMAREIKEDDSNGKVVSFEPQPDVASRLLGSIEENNLGELIEFFQLALSDEVREYSMIRDNTNLGGARISELAYTQHKNELYGIQSALFDDLYDSFGEVSIMKIDIEGAEMKFFRGATKFFSEQTPILVTEVYNQKLLDVSKSSAEEYLDTIRNLGYQIFEVRRDLELVELDFDKFKDKGAFDILAIPSDIEK